MTQPTASWPLLITDVGLSLATGFHWYILVAVALFGLAYLVYRYTLPPVSVWLRTLLWVLRGLALAVLALLIFEPILSYMFRRWQPPVVAFLLDRSASIGSVDRIGMTAEPIRKWAVESVRGLDRTAQLRVFSFADSTVEIPIDSLDGTEFTGVATDIAGAVERVQRTLADQHVAAFVLVSDGAYNTGENPVRVASESTTPVHAIGVGDTAARNDLAIYQVLTNDVAYVGTKVPIDVRVRARGFAGRETTLRLIGPQGQEFGRESLSFAGDDTELSTHFMFPVDQPGDIRVSAVVDTLNGEWSTDNNRRSVVVRVLENRSHVLLISGPPTPDLTILRQTLEADTALEVAAFIEAPGGGFLNGLEAPSGDRLARSRLIVVQNFPSAASSELLIQRLRVAILEKDVPILFLAGPQISMAKLRSLSDALPFESGKQSLSEERVVLREVGSHPAISQRSFGRTDWGDLPPVLGGLDNFRVSAPAQVVARLSREATGLTDDEAAVALWQMSRKQGAAIFCWGLYRWTMQPSRDRASFYEQLLSPVVRWLVAPAEERRVRVHPTKRLYSGGERAHLVAQVYGSELVPRDDAIIELRVSSGGRSEVVAMRNRGNGRYEGSMSPWAEGDYRYVGTATAGTDTLGEDAGMFAVEAFNIEIVDVRARFDVLQSMAAASGGHFVSLSQADSFLKTLVFKPQDVLLRRELPLWNRASMVWLIVALLAVEWIVRKRSGML